MSLNVLVVDDCDIIRAMIAKTLRLTQLPLGEVREAANGQEALEALSASWIDLVLADINMPVMDGAEMLTRMRAKPETADVPVIVVSTECARERVETLLEKGVSNWIRKPFTPEEIRDAVLDVMAGTSNGCASDIVDDAFRIVIEQFALMFAEPVSAEDVVPAPQGPLLLAHATFSGAASGAIAIAAPTAFATEVAANALGVEAHDIEARRRSRGALAEVANQTCGRVVGALESEATTVLRPPSAETLTLEEWERLAGDGSTRAYEVEGFPVLVVVGLRPGRTR